MSYHSLIKTNPTGLYLFDQLVDLSKKQAGSLSISNTVHETRSFNSGKVVSCPPSFNVPLYISNDAWSIGISAKGAGAVWKFQDNELSISEGKLVFKAGDTSVTTNVPGTMAHIFCVKDPDSIMLYVDGKLEASKELTGPVSIGDALTVGGTEKLLVSNLIIYNNALSADIIDSVHNEMTRYPFRQTLFETVGSSLFTPELISTSNQTHYLDGGYKLGFIEEPEPGTYIAVDDGQMPSHMVSVQRYIAPGIEKLAVYWDEAEGMEAEYGFEDGSDPDNSPPPIPLDQGVVINSEDVENGCIFQIAINLELDGYVKGIRLVEFNDGELRPHGYSNRKAVFSEGVYIPKTSHHIQLHGDGLRFTGDGILEIHPDESDPVDNVKSLELVFNISAEDTSGIKHIMNSAPEHSSNILVNSGKLNYAGFTGVYLNGQPISSGSATLEPGISYHLIANYTTDHNAKITFGREGLSFKGNISTIGLHKGGFNATQALDRFKMNLTYPTHSVTDSDKIGVSDPDLSIFMYDWTTSGA